MEFKPISQGWRNMLNVHPIAIIELQQKFPSQNVFFFKRKVELYSMEWQDAVDLSRFIVSAAPFGGPIALIRDDKHFARVQGSAINKPIIHIFSTAGSELATVKWDGGPIVQMGWSVTEDLLCVADDGTVMVYDIHGVIKKTLSMGQDAKESKVIDCKTYNFAGRTGIAILTSNYHFYVANNVEETVSFSAGAPVTSFIEMAISYNYEYLAMFTDTGLLWIGSADLQKVYCEFNTSCPSRPKQLTWLVLRRHYCLAIRICDHLKIPKGEGASRILGHWACYKVQQANVDDEEIARAINSKLGETPGISYSEIASKAVDCGRTHLAIKLLDYEAKAADQVPLLMRMNKDDLALEKAIMSGDTDLVYMVVMHLKDNLTLGEFLMAIRYHPVALSFYIKYCKDQDRRTLVDLFYQDDQFMNSGNAFVQDSYSEKTIESKMNTLSKAQMSYQQGGFQFYSKATEEQMKLMEYQVKLEEKYRKTFMDLSLSDTIYQCILQGDLKVAEQLKKEFRVPEQKEIRRCGGNSFFSEKRGGPGSSPWKMCNFKSSVGEPHSRNEGSTAAKTIKFIDGLKS
ncbi:Vacuolar protein sorting-associated protein 16 [Porites harrisoni]